MRNDTQTENSTATWAQLINQRAGHSPYPRFLQREDEEMYRHWGWWALKQHILGLLHSQRCSAQQVYPGCAPTGGLYYKKYYCFTTPRENILWNALLYYRGDFSPNDCPIRMVLFKPSVHNTSIHKGSVQPICMQGSAQPIYTQVPRRA